jgi:serine protease DegS
LSVKNIIRFAGWPIISGIIAAVILLALFPRLNEPEIRENSLLSNDFLTPSSGSEWSGPTSYATAVSRAAPSVVNIYTNKQVTSRTHPLFSDPNFQRLYNTSQIGTYTITSLGSGVIVSEEGFILTNHHVIIGAQAIKVQLQDGRIADVKIVGADYLTDLAVLKIELDDLHPISLGNYLSAKVGDVVLAIGNHNVGRTVTQGIISAKGQRLNLDTSADMIQTDAAINPGNSGGALIDAYGNLIGINRSIQEKATGISFAIPVDTAINALNDIITHGQVVRGWLGFNTDLVIHEQTSLEGSKRFPVLLVTATHPQSPAADAGLRIGDLITHFNGRAATDEAYMRRLSAEIKPKDKVKISVLRRNEIRDIDVIAETAPDQL